MHKLIVIVGMTSSGKDTICKYIKEQYGINMVVSHTTRPMRSYETNGKEHWFDTEESFDKIPKEHMFAYTKFPKTSYQYCAITDDLEPVMTYILNPDGISYMKKCSDIEFFSIYCNLPLDVIIDRATKRGDNPDLIKARIDSEKDEFLSFYEQKGYDYCIDTNRPLSEVFSDVDKIMNTYGYTKLKTVSPS